ncbi:MAG: hypothetical protein ABJM39_08615 [Porticoccus sp.]|jgi:hypothetical protein|uniref:hypothetical protein n=1 Tax=Porticoccus sp. TaxID=2024853 RepID=UPI003297633C|tara:strand:+ start:806708 stop:807052 length:345 start_codon:yes stop_codon:yes gene_type:complete
MKQLPGELTTMERRRLKYLGLALLLALSLGIALALYLASAVGAVIALVAGYVVWRLFILLIDRQLALTCSVCRRRGLAEIPGLPCQLPEYQCSACGARFQNGRPVSTGQTDKTP